jgi:hypothetical protein
MNTLTTFQKEPAQKRHKKCLKNMKREFDSDEVENLQLKPNRLEVQARPLDELQCHHLAQVNWLETNECLSMNVRASYTADPISEQAIENAQGRMFETWNTSQNEPQFGSTEGRTQKNQCVMCLEKL